MRSRFTLVVEGVLVFGVIAIWAAAYCVLNPPTKSDLGLALYYSLGERAR